jgi:FkbM family methyltransferase
MNDIELPDFKESQRLLGRLAALEPLAIPPKPDRPLVLYGAGSMGVLAADLFARLGIPVEYALDRRPPTAGLMGGRIPVIAPDRAPLPDRRTHCIAVSIVNFPFEPTRQVLADMGWRHIVPVYDILESCADRLPMHNGWFSGLLTGEDIEKINGVLECWSDDASRAAHLQCLAWRMHRQEWTFAKAPVSIDDRYFIGPIIEVLRGDEFFLDAGACHGDVLRKFAAIVNGACAGILALEPDGDNLAILENNAHSFGDSLKNRIEILNAALGAAAGMRPFIRGMGLASKLHAAGETNVKVLRLDDLDCPASFVKLHLEGGELEALQGGLAFLRRNRPLLAVTTYHSRDGAWRIPDLLMQALPDYRFLMRLHAWCGTGCVVYAIPRERCARI